MRKLFRQESNKIHLYKKNIPQSGGWIRRKQTGGAAGAAPVRNDEGLSGLGKDREVAEERDQELQQVASTGPGDRWGRGGQRILGPSACDREEADSTNALGLEQREHVKKEGNSSFGFRNVWLTMVETCRQLRNMGGTVIQKKQELGTEI